MVISIHDVPLQEKYLLFCTTLSNGAARRRHARRRRNFRVAKRVLALIGESVGGLSQRVPAAPSQVVA